LDDVDWRHGEVVVRGKGGHRDRLPLPGDVGRVLADYLRSGRPVAALDRRVFIRVKAPHRGLTNTGVTQVVNAASHRAGLGTIYAHRLRHSAATAMLAAASNLTIRCTGMPSMYLWYSSRARNPAVNRPFGTGFGAGSAVTVRVPTQSHRRRYRSRRCTIRTSFTRQSI
jgi:hypothetical protein